MEIFFNPKAVAVIGASTKNLGNFVVKNLLNGFNGPVYPVNANYTEIEGITCFSSIEEIPGETELAIVLVPARAVPEVVRACARKGIRRVIIESAGFAETGEEGTNLQNQCIDIAKSEGMRLWGPNCMGLVDVNRGHYFTFMHPRVREEGLLPGKISLIVQSGMMSAIFLAELGRRGIGVAKACSIGNRADVDECDIIEYLENDPDTEVIALYLESIPRGRLFARLAERSAKPVVLLKGGQSNAGAVAAVSHTGSLAGNSRLLASVLELAGVIMADSVFQMMDMANALATMKQIDPRCRTAILTMSGGAGILACDALEKNEIPIAKISEPTREELGKVFPDWMPVFNPIDLFPAVSLHGRSVAFEHALSSTLRDPEVDCLVIHFVAGLEAETPDLLELKKTANANNKAAVFWLMGRREGSADFRENARAAGITVYDDAARLAECLKAVSRFSARKPALITQDDFAETRAQSPTLKHFLLENPGMPDKVMDESDSKRILAEYSIPVVEEKLADDPETAWEAARQIGVPVVMKGLVPGKTHKTEHGLVKLGIMDKPAIESAFADISEKMAGNGRILIAKQVSFDYELIAGFLRDNQFGPCVMFGLGGILAELEPDVVFAPAPVSISGALKLINSIRNKKLINGFRNMHPLDKDAMARIIVNLGDMGIAHDQIEQIDINPLAVCAGKPAAVDAGIVLKDKAH